MMIASVAAPNRSVAARFHAAASTYDRYADVQTAVAERLLEVLPSSLSPHRLLEVGCGTGILTERLLQRFPGVALTACDIAAGMLNQARRRCAHEAITWLQADPRELPEQQWELIVSSSALHWMTPLATALVALQARLAAGGTLGCSVMVDGTLAELHASRRRVAPGKPVPASLPTPAALIAAMTSAGLVPVTTQRQTCEAWYPEAKALLAALHAQGLTAGPYAASRSPLSRGELVLLCNDYDSRYVGADGVRATFEVCHFVVRKIAGQ